jgi:hypothetical protein
MNNQLCASNAFMRGIQLDPISDPDFGLVSPQTCIEGKYLLPSLS